MCNDYFVLTIAVIAVKTKYSKCAGNNTIAGTMDDMATLTFVVKCSTIVEMNLNCSGMFYSLLELPYK